jgi:MFS family permease
MASDQAVQATEGAAEPRSVFANADFTRLWAGETVSLIGNQVTQFTMPLVAVLTLNATVLEVGVLNSMRFVPVLLLSVFAGVWLDRRRRRPVLIVCALGNAGLIGLVPVAAATGHLSIGLLYAVQGLVGTLNMIFDVGALSYVPFLVDRKQLPHANARLQASTAVAGFSGPGLAGLLVGLITAPVTLSVDAASYLASAIGLISVRRREPAPEPPPHDFSVWGSIAEGFRTVFGSRLLRALITQSTVLNLFYGSFFVIFMVYAIRTVHLSPLELGIVMGASAVGGLAGALLATRARKALGYGKAMAVTTIGVSASLLIILIPRHASVLTVVIMVAAQLGYGASISAFNVNAITLRQVVTPTRLLARMNATYRMLIWGAPLLGAVMGGLLGSAVGLRDAVVISLFAMTSPTLWIFFSPVFRLEEMPTGPLAQEGTT